MGTISVSNDFSELCSKLRMSDTTVSSIQARYHAVTKKINEEYWNSSSDTLHSMYSGSYGRGTAIFASDIDMIVELPWSLYSRYDSYIGNGQSALLQDVRKTLQKTYSTSAINADGQVIDIKFTDGIKFEVVPAFKFNDGSYYYADTNNGGRWRSMNPKAEISALNTLNNCKNGNVKRFCRMVRAWNHTNTVLMPGYLIDATVYRFLANYQYAGESYTYFDWFSRDYFQYLLDNADQTYWIFPGSNTHVSSKYSFDYDARKARLLIDEALEAYSADFAWTWATKWRGVYGTKFPMR